MSTPILSKIAESAEASVIRNAQESFRWRDDNAEISPVNLAIGNVSLPMHPGMLKRARDINSSEHLLSKGVVSYTATVGTDKARAGVLNIIKTLGFNIDGLYSHVTAGGTGAMELMIRACCEKDKPLMLIEPYYTNYQELAVKLGIPTTFVSRKLQDDGHFSLPNLDEIKSQIHKTGSNALVVIPYDNPSGQFLPQSVLVEIAKICVENNIWMISDEAYRGLVYTNEKPSSIWGITENEVPGITGRRISIESVSKLFNACGLRMGALITDNKQLHQQAVKMASPELCASVIAQYIIEALEEEDNASMTEWIEYLRGYYKKLITSTVEAFKKRMPGLIVSSPDASIYFVIDFKNIDPNFDAKTFVNFCAKEGRVNEVQIEGKPGTLFLAPMAGFYSSPNSGKTQMRVAAVDTEERMLLAPELCARLFEQYRKEQRHN